MSPAKLTVRARIEIVPDLVEEAVFLRQRSAELRGDIRGIEWMEARERFYDIREPHEREAAFFGHALRAFRAMRLDDPLHLALEACPSASARLGVLVVRRARRVKEESAELYCGTETWAASSPTRAVMALRPERFADVERLHEHVRRELLFIDDMLDPEFEYDPQGIDRLELDPGMRDVVRERASRAWRRRIEARVRGERPSGTFVELVDRAVATLGSAVAGEEA